MKTETVVGGRDLPVVEAVHWKSPDEMEALAQHNLIFEALQSVSQAGEREILLLHLLLGR